MHARQVHVSSSHCNQDPGLIPSRNRHPPPAARPSISVAMSSNSTRHPRPGRSTDVTGGSAECAIVRALDFEIEPSQKTCCPGLPSLDVRCDEHDRVTGILVSEQMTKADGSGLHGGPLPESIGRLDQVYIIWAYGNNLSGEIPQSMNNLRKLQNLNLSNNSLTGSIPDIFSDKPLTYLDLTLNRFTGPVPPLPYMASSCYITSYSSTEGNKFTCLAGDPLNHRGACYDNLRALQLQPCTPHRPPVATDVPPDPQEQAPPQPTSAGPPGLPPVMIVLISMSATAAFVSIVALSVFTAQQRRRKRRLEATDLAAGAGPSGAKDVVYAKLAVGAEQGHLYTAVQGQSAVLSRGGEAGGLVFVVPKQGHRGRGQQVMLMPAAPRQVREEEELFLPQEEVEIPEVDIGE